MVLSLANGRLTRRVPKGNREREGSQCPSVDRPRGRSDAAGFSREFAGPATQRSETARPHEAGKRRHTWIYGSVSRGRRSRHGGGGVSDTPYRFPPSSGEPSAHRRLYRWRTILAGANIGRLGTSRTGRPCRPVQHCVGLPAGEGREANWPACLKKRAARGLAECGKRPNEPDEAAHPKKEMGFRLE